jgi:hypothetical protein
MRTAESVLLTCWPPEPEARLGVDAELLVDELDLDVVVDLSPTDRRRCEA